MSQSLKHYGAFMLSDWNHCLYECQHVKTKRWQDRSDVVLLKTQSQVCWKCFQYGWRNCDRLENPILETLALSLLRIWTWKKHVSTVCRSTFFRKLRNIGRIRKFLTTDVTKTLMSSLVTSKLDCCNSLLVGISNST